MTVDQVINNLINGEALFDSERILDNLMNLFLMEVKGSIFLGCEILAICIVTGLLSNFSGTFGSKTVSSLGTMICGVVITERGVNVTVNSEELDQSMVTKICDIVMRETGREASQIIVQDAS